jgi:transcriptional regulator with XRE-family HTH domain
MSFILSLSSEIQSVLGQRLRTQRLGQSLTQGELADMAGLSLGAVRKLERNGQSTLETFVRVAQTLGLVQELDPLFEFRKESIAQMERADQVTKLKRAPRKSANPRLGTQNAKLSVSPSPVRPSGRTTTKP